MPIEIKELIVKGTVEEAKKKGNTDITKIIQEKIAEIPPPQCSLNKTSLIEECVQEVLEELRKQLDY
jgi:hypothetical protein|tara:strand:+ start:323 stop:523 length:201 start_codon:yes stop_codon:yes gene_type:complete